MKQSKKRKSILNTLFKLVVIIASIYFATYAWFITFRQNEVEGLGAAVSKANNVTISVDGGESWNSSVDLAIAKNFEFNNEITGDGISLYKASVKTEVGNPAAFIPAVVNEDYLEFTIMFRTESSTAIFLEKESSITPAAGTEAEVLIDSDKVINKSADGNFSRDLIAGSIRLAFIANTSSGLANETSLVWAPNKNYEIIDNGNDLYTASITSANYQSYKYYKVNSDGSWQLSDLPNLKETISANNNSKTAYGDPYLMYIPVNDGETSATAAVTIRVWVEGNDRDAVTSLIGGEFKMKLFFTAIDKAIDNEEPNVSVLDNTIGNYDSTMEYSADRGNIWIPYASNNNPTFESGQVVYVRKSETSNFFASKYKILNF